MKKMHGFHSFCLPSLQIWATKGVAGGGGGSWGLNFDKLLFLGKGEVGSQWGRQGVGVCSGGADILYFKACPWPAKENCPVVLLTYPATAPLTAPQHGHFYKKNMPWETGREAEPLTPSSPQILLFRWSSPFGGKASMEIMKFTNIKGKICRKQS